MVDVPKKPGQRLVPRHKKGTLEEFKIRQGYDPVTGRRLGTGEPPPSSATPIDPMSAQFGAGPASLETFRKPSDLLTQAEEPTLEDIRRVLKSREHFLTATALPTDENQNPTASSLAEYDRIRRKHGSQALRWEEGWEEAGRELGFKTDPELRVLINQIYAPAERDLETRPDFWSLEEGPQFEKTVQNIRNLRAKRWDNDKQAYISASESLKEFKKALSGEVSTVKKEGPELSASQMLQQFKERVASGISRVAEAVSREPEKPPAAKAVDKMRTAKAQKEENLASYREAFANVKIYSQISGAPVKESDGIEKLAQSLIPNRSGNFKPVYMLKGRGFGQIGSVAAYRGYVLEREQSEADDSLEWRAHVPEDHEASRNLGFDTMPTLKEMKEAIDDIWDLPIDDEISPHNRLDGKLISKQTQAELVAQETEALKEKAERFEKIREEPPVGEEISAELLPEETFETSAIGKGRQSLFDPELKEGRRLLIMSCCITKTDDPGQIPALERYAGSLFQTLKKQGIPDDVDVAILSAKHGLIRINHPLSTYDTRMTKATQKKLLEDDEFTRLVQGTLEGYDDILVAGGKLYREPIRELSLRRDWSRGSTGTMRVGGFKLPVSPGTITETVGTQGVQRKELKEWLRKSYGNDTLDEMIDDLRRPGKGSTERETHGPSLQAFVREKGISRVSVDALGLRGEIENLEIESDRKPGQKLVVRDGGMDMDEIVTAATEAGYLDEGQSSSRDWEMRPSISDFLEVLSQSMRDPVYSYLEEDPDKIGWEEALDDLDRRMSELDIDLNQSNKAIRKELELEEYPDPYDTEKTEAGEQALVPGVDPVTTQDILEVEANRPLSGGSVDEGPLFDLEARTQLDIEDVPQVEEDPRMVEELGSFFGEERLAITRDAEPEFETTGEPGFGTVYHGTDYEGKIVEFNVPAYFTDKKEFAQGFGKNITEAEIHITNPYEIDGLTEGRHFDWDKEDVDRMIEEGYDGVVIRHPDGDVYTVFDPSQISQRNEGKAAFETRGDLDRFSPDRGTANQAVGTDGFPVPVWRGTYYDRDSSIEGRMPSITFTSSENEAVRYAIEPNRTYENAPVKPMLSKAYVSIEKPLVNRPYDPFMNYNELVDVIGRKDAIKVARQIEKTFPHNQTDSWLEDFYEKEGFENLEDVLDKAPDKFDNILVNTYAVLDNPYAVERLIEEGYDGAIYGEYAAEDESTEYRVFSPSQIKEIKGNVLKLSDHIKKAYGGFIDKPLYERSL